MKKAIKLFDFDLQSKVSIYVPSTKNVNEKTDNTEYVRDIIGTLSDYFGGATASKAVGGWRSADGQIVIEDVTIVYAYCTDEQLQDHIHDILGICEQLKREMSQEAITLEINGQIKFI